MPGGSYRRFPNNDCVIVDYKSSKTAESSESCGQSHALAGPALCTRRAGKLGLNPVAMIYWAVRDDERYGWGRIPGTDLEFQPMPPNWAEDARIRTIERLSGFLGGAVHARPEEAEPCRWCDYRHACRVEETLVTIEGAHGA